MTFYRHDFFCGFPLLFHWSAAKLSPSFSFTQDFTVIVWWTVLFTIRLFEAMPIFFCVILCKLQIDIFFFATETCWKICFMLLCNILPDSLMYQRENCFSFPSVHFFLDEVSNNLRFCIQYRVIKREQRCYQSI